MDMITKANITEKQLDRIHKVLSQVIGGNLKDNPEQIQSNRKYVLRSIIEIYAGWKDRLNCLPEMIQIGAYNPIYLRIVKCDIYGNLLEK